MTAPIPIIRLLLILGCLLTVSAAPAAAAPGTAEARDIRVLIDISGSMKWNDPENLRVPALRLLTGLLPGGTRSGVWTFGRYVNMLVPYGDVDRAWKDNARQAAEQINSAGLFTDIETALEKATWNWNTPGEGVERSIILLTDGFVDVSRNEAPDRASRERIVGDILPRLQRAGVIVHTIALSGDADEVLLQQMAAATGGWFEHPRTSENLEKVFFRMFEKAANPDTIPLVGNEVLVDESIKEITLLVFRKDGAPATTLSTPDGVTFGSDRLPPNVAWHSDDSYDLVTVSRPMTGSWRVNADVDPDNRVMVVTDLRVIATQLPNQILAGDEHELYVHLTEGGRVIEKREFLHFIKVNVLQHSDGSPVNEWTLLDNGRKHDANAGDGLYSLRLTDSLSAGEHELTVSVDGTTFRREHRQTVNVVTSPVVARISEGRDGPVLYVLPRAGIIEPDTLKVIATVAGPDGTAAARTVPRTGPNEWRLALAEYADAPHRLTVDIEAERPSGRPVTHSTAPLAFGRNAEASAVPVPEPEPVPEPASEPEPAPQPATPPASDTTATTAQDETAAREPPATNWSLVSLQVVLINLLLGGGIYLSYRKWFSNAKPRIEPWKDLAHE